jgi:hypothetical protein
MNLSGVGVGAWLCRFLRQDVNVSMLVTDVISDRTDDLSTENRSFDG